MKLLNLLLENVKVPFKEKCTIGITNNDGKTVTVKCEVPSTDEEKMVGLMYREKDELCDNCGMFYDYVDGGLMMMKLLILKRLKLMIRHLYDLQ